MIEFIKTLNELLATFPSALTVALVTPIGAVLYALRERKKGNLKTPKEIVENVFIGTVTGYFCGALMSPMIGAIAPKVPVYCSSFISGASGYWFFNTFLPKKQDDFANHNNHPNSPTDPPA